MIIMLKRTIILDKVFCSPITYFGNMVVFPRKPCSRKILPCSLRNACVLQGTWLCSFGKYFSSRQNCWSNPRKKLFSQRTRVAFYFFPRNTTMFLREHKHFFGNMIVLVLGKKHFPGKHNHFLGNMVTLSWSTWFMVSLWIQPSSLGNRNNFFENDCPLSDEGYPKQTLRW
jgi:hypothetical protein